jgi:hypothetical protein
MVPRIGIVSGGGGSMIGVGAHIHILRPLKQLISKEISSEPHPLIDIPLPQGKFIG